MSILLKPLGLVGSNAAGRSPFFLEPCRACGSRNSRSLSHCGERAPDRGHTPPHIIYIGTQTPSELVPLSSKPTTSLSVPHPRGVLVFPARMGSTSLNLPGAPGLDFQTRNRPTNAAAAAGAARPRKYLPLRLPVISPKSASSNQTRPIPDPAAKQRRAKTPQSIDAGSFVNKIFVFMGLQRYPSVSLFFTLTCARIGGGYRQGTGRCRPRTDQIIVRPCPVPRLTYHVPRITNHERHISSLFLRMYRHVLSFCGVAAIPLRNSLI